MGGHVFILRGGSMTQALPQTMTTLYLQPSGLYTATSTGATGEVPALIAVTDAVCYDDLDANGNETTTDAQALAQDVYHILLEILGSNPDDLNRGVGVEGFSSGSAQDLAALPSIIDSQLRKDTRIDSSQSSLTVTSTTSPPSYSLLVNIVADGSIIPLGFSYAPSTGLVSA
jgi:hypothetical protein